MNSRNGFRSTLAVVIVFAMSLLASSLGAAPDTPAPDKATKAAPVVEVVFDQVPSATAVAQLPDVARPLAQAIAAEFPGSRFAFIDDYDGGTLIVQAGDPQLRGKINPLSDCPNNTQFNVQHVSKEAVRGVLVAWTRLRHIDKPGAADAPVLAIHISDRDIGLNFDVQLKLPPPPESLSLRE